MACKSTKQERPGIEYAGSNTFRVGFLPTITDENGNKVRRWVRKTFTYPDTLTHDQQLDLAEAALALLRSRHTQQVIHVDVDDLSSADQLTIAQLCQLWIDTKLPTESADYEMYHPAQKPAERDSAGFSVSLDNMRVVLGACTTRGNSHLP